MFKTTIAAPAAAIAFAPAAPPYGPYVNVETNAGWAGDDYTGATTDAMWATKVLWVTLVHPSMSKVFPLSYP